MIILEVQKLNRYFGGLHAVADVSFKVPENVIKAVIGPNGAGKTTIFNLITGSLLPSSGTVNYYNENITGIKPHYIAEKGIFRTFQTLKLNHHMSVLENVMLGAHTKSSAGFLPGILNLPWTRREEKDVRAKAITALDFFGVADNAEDDVDSLPFGKQRAVEFARAMCGNPKLLLLDEPASGLNIHETEELAGIITSIRNQGVTIILVEHDMSLVMDISDEIVVLDFGRKLAEGLPHEIQKNEQVIKIYLGSDDA